MTHEELVEIVAEGIHRNRQGSKYGGSASWSLLSEGTRNAVRRQARAAIKIVGEACADSAPEIAREIAVCYAPPETVIKSAILSLTQGTKE